MVYCIFQWQLEACLYFSSVNVDFSKFLCLGTFIFLNISNFSVCLENRINCMYTFIYTIYFIIFKYDCPHLIYILLKCPFKGELNAAGCL